MRVASRKKKYNSHKLARRAVEKRIVQNKVNYRYMIKANKLNTSFAIGNDTIARIRKDDSSELNRSQKDRRLRSKFEVALECIEIRTQS